MESTFLGTHSVITLGLEFSCSATMDALLVALLLATPSLAMLLQATNAMAKCKMTTRSRITSSVDELDLKANILTNSCSEGWVYIDCAFCVEQLTATAAATKLMLQLQAHHCVCMHVHNNEHDH